MDTKNTTLTNIEKSGSKYYKSQVMAFEVFNDVLNGLTDEEIVTLANMPKESLNIHVGFTLWDVIKTAFGK